MSEVVFERSLRARRYRLTLRRDGTVVATIPVRGSEREALRFVEAHRAWLDRALARQQRRPKTAEVWTIGTSVLWRGELTEIRLVERVVPNALGKVVIRGQNAVGASALGLPAEALAKAGTTRSTRVVLAADVFALRTAEGDVRPGLEAQFARRAKIELPGRAWELAAVTKSDMKHVSVRNQRSRWGSCSANGTVSLNWRLIQTPDLIRDYIILHELMHLRQMNHSDRFWAEVAAVCPQWKEAERWLKQNGSLVGM